VGESDFRFRSAGAKEIFGGREFYKHLAPNGEGNNDLFHSGMPVAKNTKGRKPLDLLPLLLPTAAGLRSRFPAANVLKLFCRQRVDGHSEGA
jgi:hypothetical protein